MLVMAKATGEAMNNGFELEVPGGSPAEIAGDTQHNLLCGGHENTLCSKSQRKDFIDYRTDTRQRQTCVTGSLPVHHEPIRIESRYGCLVLETESDRSTRGACCD